MLFCCLPTCKNKKTTTYFYFNLPNLALNELLIPEFYLPGLTFLGAQLLGQKTLIILRR